MNKEIEALKPCPFCGGEAEIDPRFGAVSVDCKSCFSGAGPHDTEAEAIAAWNTRQAADQLERYREALERISRGNYDGLEVTHMSRAACRYIARQSLEPKP